ncbi:hypothetical protein [uncultured Roseovarius sp.]|nr:hypothetical protein [uncultured Roseovarius sp.]
MRQSFLVLDGPTASIDISVRARIICLPESFRDDIVLIYLCISHDLSLWR